MNQVMYVRHSALSFLDTTEDSLVVHQQYDISRQKESLELLRSDSNGNSFIRDNLSLSVFNGGKDILLASAVM